MPNQHTPPPPTRPPTEIASTGKDTVSPTIQLDPEEWLPYLDDPDATEEEKLALIETLWGIVLSFVDLGWAIETEPSNGFKSTPRNGRVLHRFNAGSACGRGKLE